MSGAVAAVEYFHNLAWSLSLSLLSVYSPFHPLFSSVYLLSIGFQIIISLVGKKPG
jgi:hypothetical protein